MEKDLKASLEWLKDCAENGYIFETGDSKLLLDYITNLQETIDKATQYYLSTLAQYEKEFKKMPDEAVKMFNLLENNK